MGGRQRRDWDKVRRENRARKSGILPYWQDGWASSVELVQEPPEFRLIGDIQGGFATRISGQQQTIFRDQQIVFGVSRIIWDWITEPLRSCPKNPNMLEAFRRLTEKTYISDQTFRDGILTTVHQKKAT